VQVSGADTVATDHVAGAREITEYLLQLGHRQIAYIGVQTLHSSRHFRGYLEALHEAGVTVDPRLQIHIGRSDLRNLETVGELGVEQLYAQDVPFTAVFAQIDPIAIGVLRALRARGVSVPDQVSVVGFDNIPSAEHVHPPLTTVDHTVAEIGRLAVLLLQDRIVGRYDGPSRRVIIQPRLMIRGSCGPAPEL
jgi:LacI family transcriptional regulator